MKSHKIMHLYTVCNCVSDGG